jgi:hypothetical protein
MTIVPRQFGEQKTHATEIGDARKNQTGPDEPRQTKKGWMHPPAQQHPQQDQRPGGNANLAFQAYHFGRSASDGQASLNPSLRPAFNDHAAILPCGRELLRRFGGTHSCPAKKEHRSAIGQSARGNEFLRLEAGEGLVSSLWDVGFREFNGRSHVQ